MFISKTDMLTTAIAILLVILWLAGNHGVYLYGCGVALTALVFATSPEGALESAAHLFFKDGSVFKLFLICALTMGYLLFPCTLRLVIALIMVGFLFGLYMLHKIYK